MKIRRTVRGTSFVPVHDPLYPEVGWGVLRRRLDDVTNTLPAFVQLKLQPIRREIASVPWERSCWRDDVILPPGATDDMCDIRTLCERFEASALPDLKDLALSMVIRVEASEPLHVAWEKVRRFAHQSLAIDRKMAVIMVGHVPAHAGSRAAPHIHLIAPARQLTAQGFGAHVGRIASDRGLPILAAEWRAHR